MSLEHLLLSRHPSQTEITENRRGGVQKRVKKAKICHSLLLLLNRPTNEYSIPGQPPLHHAVYTLHSTPYTPNSKLQIPGPRPQAPTPNPQHQHQTPAPKSGFAPVTRCGWSTAGGGGLVFKARRLVVSLNSRPRVIKKNTRRISAGARQTV